MRLRVDSIAGSSKLPQTVTGMTDRHVAGNKMTSGAINETNKTTDSSEEETMQERIVRVTVDEQELQQFFNISFSRDRQVALRKYFQDEIGNLDKLAFEDFSQDDKVDWLLLKNYLKRSLRRLGQEAKRYTEIQIFLPFADDLVALCEARQRAKTADIDPKTVAQELHDSTQQAKAVQAMIEKDKLEGGRMAAFRAVRCIQELVVHIEEFYGFFKTYDPLFDWWVSTPYIALKKALADLLVVIQDKLIGDLHGDIIGDAIGREGLVTELEAEFIPYTPDQLVAFGAQKYWWCLHQMKKASEELGFGDDWKAALEHVKNLYTTPGSQPQLIKRLVDEGASYVKTRDLVTVPPLAEQTWRMFMMSPAAQRVNPFFLGGDSIIVSYPTAEMAHEDKLMSLRGNNQSFARATAFHEMIPGHRLQLFMGDRHRPYRRLFSTPFFVEGWAMYWELVFWERGDFFIKPEDRVGTLFWRMHRCLRIIFSLRFHMGEIYPDQCVSLLVEMGGHERATAEGEVRRSLNGDYSPLYQAGYMLGALQLWALREEVLEKGVLTEKEFHDKILRTNEMPIELLRALLLGKELTRDYKSEWEFEGDIDPEIPWDPDDPQKTSV
jgi:hypothetical protein